MRAITAARCARRVTNTCAPMKRTRPITRIVMGAPAGPVGPAVEAMAGPEARRSRRAGLDRLGDNAFTLARDHDDEGNANATVCACTAGTAARARRGGGAGLAHQDRADHRAVRAG